MIKNFMQKVEQYFWNNIKPLLLLLFSIATILYAISYFIDNLKLSIIIKDIASVIVAGAIFQFILKSRGFIKVVDETLDHTKRQWTKYSFEYIMKLLQSIRATHTFFEFTFNETINKSIKNAKDEYLKILENAKNNPRTDDVEKLLKRNFFIQELTNTRTIYKNGVEIVIFEAVIEIIKDGIFSFQYTISPSNPQNNFPDFSHFLENMAENRFTDFSFSAKIIDLPEYITDANLIIKAEVDEPKKKIIGMSLNKTFLSGDKFTLMFSVTTKNEYSKEFLQTIKNSKCSTPPSSTSIYPIGIRNIIIQEEHYGESQNYEYLLDPKIFVDGTKIEKLRIYENLFYKVHKWKIFYSEIQHGHIRIDMI
ncbi:hypothetical protein [Aliarcobacter butzleri]|uniref:hypothetical protein n=1 Tax=Aliarcobacter butzleri TaxID=28197 RepID=UPI003AF73706